jgi:hypothetical protein
MEARANSPFTHRHVDYPSECFARTRNEANSNRREGCVSESHTEICPTAIDKPSQGSEVGDWS